MVVPTAEQEGCLMALAGLSMLQRTLENCEYGKSLRIHHTEQVQQTVHIIALLLQNDT